MMTTGLEMSSAREKISKLPEYVRWRGRPFEYSVEITRAVVFFFSGHFKHTSGPSFIPALREPLADIQLRVYSAMSHATRTEKATQTLVVTA